MTHSSPAAADLPSAPILTRSDIESLLVQHGYRLTQPRTAVVKAVLGYSQPFTAEQLVADMGAVGGGIGRATIYRTLEILAAIDVLSRIIQPDGHPAYICDSTGHRHHIVCSSCGVAVAFRFCPLDDLVPALARDTSFEIHDHLLEVFGTCPTCQQPAVGPA
jgi:Fur family transcriptional regulator, ferric uptake regulator